MIDVGRKRTSRMIGTMLVTMVVATVVWSTSAHAQTLEVSMRDTTGYAGQRIFVPIYLAADADSVAGFQLGFTLDRPDVAEFPVDTLIDTLILCANPPDCTVMDTTIDTTASVVFDLTGTLCENWDYFQATTFAATDVRLTGLANLTTGNGNVLPPFTSGVLARIAIDIFCDQPIFNGGEVIIQPNLIFSTFSDAQGQRIEPFSVTGATVTIPDPVACDLDYSGYPDAVDFNKFIQCLFFNYPFPDCDAVQVDFDCSGAPDAVDLNIMIEYLFFNGPEPQPCP